MATFQVLSAILIPFLLGIGGTAAFLASRRREEQDRERAAAWRDTSLDDWRRERERIAEEERALRAATGETRTGSTEERDEKKQHQRIGG